ncbi:5-hydroxyisourate hydrolase [Orchesella cincta]|uniref:5-hydroxyisourate hydrolase n=1 Tax=Orchesella cincta TaxID=48709 RepID=A0A1D2MDV8_ORCCI|nr:5-hydroxyisourate hydrolase [Orchesella cincta]
MATEENNTLGSNSSTASVATNSSPLTSHVLDTGIGRPAVGVSITLSKYEDKELTNADGWVGNLISSYEFTSSRFKLTFDTLAYYEGRGGNTFYPYIDVVFEIERPEEHHYIPTCSVLMDTRHTEEADFN